MNRASGTFGAITKDSTFQFCESQKIVKGLGLEKYINNAYKFNIFGKRHRDIDSGSRVKPNQKKFILRFIA